MSTEQLDSFVRKAIGINSTIPTFGGAAGVFGITSMGEKTVNELKRTVISFATEYRKGAASKETARLGQEIEGLLVVLQVMSIITDKRCEEFTNDLHDLAEAYS